MQVRNIHGNRDGRDFMLLSLRCRHSLLLQEEASEANAEHY